MSYHDDQPISYIRKHGLMAASKPIPASKRKSKADSYKCATCDEMVYFRGKGSRSKYCLECKYENARVRRNSK